MPASSDLWSTVQPLTVWVTLHQPESSEHTERSVSLRVQQPPARSLTITARVDIYSSEAQVLMACAKVVEQLEHHQGPLDHNDMVTMLGAAIDRFVEPF